MNAGTLLSLDVLLCSGTQTAEHAGAYRDCQVVLDAAKAAGLDTLVGGLHPHTRQNVKTKDDLVSTCVNSITHCELRSEFTESFASL